MLNLFQHLLVFRRLRVKPAMTGARQTGFLEVPKSFFLSSLFPFLFHHSSLRSNPVSKLVTCNS